MASRAWHVQRPFFLILVALLAFAAPASAQTLPPGASPELTEPFMRLNLQAPELAVEFSATFPGGAPESWSATVWQPGSLPGPDHPGATEQLIARGAGVGQPARFVLPVLDPQWRWKLIGQPDMEVYLRWTWTVQGQTYNTTMLAGLSMFTNAGRSDGGLPVGGVDGRFPIYSGPGYVNPPPDPLDVALGQAVSDRYDASSFLSGSRLRRSVKLPWTVPWEGASKLRVVVKFPRGRNPGFGIPVYAGSARPPDREGAAVSVTLRLTPKGRRLARALGAKRLAAKLGSAGIADYWFRPIRAEAPERTWVPIGTCFHDYQRPKRFPCAQTCPPFPGMPNGYLLYTALDNVYGSYTCRKGDALPPVPMG